MVERHGRVASGEFAQWRTWLVQRTARASMYPTTDGAPAPVGGRRPAHLPKGKRVHRTEVYDVPGVRAGRTLVHARCLVDGCTWQTEPMSNVVTAALVGSAHEVAPEASGGPDDGPACGLLHPSGDTRCVLAAGHEDVVARHADVIGRSW